MQTRFASSVCNTSVQEVTKYEFKCPHPPFSKSTTCESALRNIIVYQSVNQPSSDFFSGLNNRNHYKVH